MDKNLLDLLVYQIKISKNLKNLGDGYVLKKVEAFFLRNGNIRKKLELEFERGINLLKNKVFKETSKQIRAEIGQVYSQFLTSKFPKKRKFLDSVSNLDESLPLLFYHKSTRERVDFYDEIYLRIFDWHKPKKICDIACGLNPISYPKICGALSYKPEYFAFDLAGKDMDFLNFYFKKFGICAVAKPFDFCDLNFLEDKDFLDSDLIFLFKALDSFEEIKIGIFADFLRRISKKKLVVSFPTKSLVAKNNIKINKRNWFLRVLEKQGLPYKSFEVENEVFFLVG